MKTLLCFFTLLASTSIFSAEYAAKELHAERMAAHDLREKSGHQGDIHIGSKDMGNGIRCFYLNQGRETASQTPKQALSCLKIQ